MSPVDSLPPAPESHEPEHIRSEGQAKERAETDRRADALRVSLTEELAKGGGLTEARWKSVFDRAKTADAALLQTLGIADVSGLKAFVIIPAQTRRDIVALRRATGFSEIQVALSGTLSSLRPADVKPAELIELYGESLAPALTMVSPFDIFGKLAPLVNALPQKAALRIDAAQRQGNDSDQARTLRFLIGARTNWGRDEDAGRILQLVCVNLSLRQLEGHIKKWDLPIAGPRLAEVRSFMNSDWVEDLSASGLTLTRETHNESMRTGVWQDPALAEFRRVDEAWIDWSPLPQDPARLPGLKIQFRAMIARNLYFTGQPVTRDTARAEFTRILETRERIGKTPLFAGRNVLLAAHGEPLDRARFGKAPAGEKNSFGTDGLAAAIRAQQGKGRSFERIRAENLERTADTKKQILASLRTGAVPFTFYFDGHGSPDGLFLSQGVPNDRGEVQATDPDTFISPQELADAFKARHEAFGEALARQPDVLVMSCCFSSNFMRSFHQALGNVPKPIIIGESEYNQFGYYNPENPLGSEFATEVLGLNGREPSTVGRAMQGERAVNGADGKPIGFRSVVYIPDDRNRPMQIARKGRREPPAA